MYSASEELGHIRPLVEAAVERLTKHDGLSAMDAYTKLGRQIGKSERWVRKVIGRDETAAVRLRDLWNIEAACERLCARIDGVSERIESDTKRRREARRGREDAVRAGPVAEAAGPRDPGLVPGMESEGEP